MERSGWSFEQATTGCEKTLVVHLAKGTGIDNYMDAMPSAWKQIRHRIEWLALKAAAVTIPVFGRDALPFLGCALGSAAYALDSRSRRDALDNLKAAFPEITDERKRKCIARRSLQAFAQAQLDAFWTPRLDADNYLEFVSFEFESPDIEERAREKGAIWVTPHYGNFEWISLVFGFRGFPFKVIAQPFKNPLLDPIFTSHREHSGHEVIPQKGAALKLFRHLKSGGHAAFLIDLSQAPDQAATIIQCHGLYTSVTKTHAELAARTGLPLIPTICVPREDGGYCMRIFDPIEDVAERPPREVAQECWDKIEPHIAADPAPWLWAYKHWRYLPKDELRATRPYPSYANSSKKFDKLADEVL